MLGMADGKVRLVSKNACGVLEIHDTAALIEQKQISTGIVPTSRGALGLGVPPEVLRYPGDTSWGILGRTPWGTPRVPPGVFW